jgi:hypothetical protein
VSQDNKGQLPSVLWPDHSPHGALGAYGSDLRQCQLEGDDMAHALGALKVASRQLYPLFLMFQKPSLLVMFVLPWLASVGLLICLGPGWLLH